MEGIMNANNQVLQQALNAIKANYSAELEAAKKARYESEVKATIAELTSRAEKAKQQIDNDLATAIAQANEENTAICTEQINAKYEALVNGLQSLMTSEA